MKVLLSWLCRYLNVSHTSIDVAALVYDFNVHTAEIEHFEKITIPYQSFFLAQARHANQAEASLFCPELGCDISLPVRSDFEAGSFYLVKQNGDLYAWVRLVDCGSSLEGLLPAIHVEAQHHKGSWRSLFPVEDYVLDVDNKSINHRPDLWGHYGIAREIAVFKKYQLRPIDDLIAPVQVVTSDKASDLRVSIESSDCSGLAAFRSDIVQQDSDLVMAIKLAQVDIKPIAAIVDITNFVMLDIGHPMHAFDASAFQDNTLVARQAKSKESLTILDGQSLSLTNRDLVIANGTQALSLAGIMGGKSSAINKHTKAVVLEAGGFDPAVIRLTAQHYKLRTQASMRFEKNLDPMASILALKRYVYLASELQLFSGIGSNQIVTAGLMIPKRTCLVSHDYIESMIGMTIDSSYVMHTLEQLGFGVVYNKGEYDIVIPSYRATKDIRFAHDIVEEIVRIYGYQNITPLLPTRKMAPFDLSMITKTSQIKQYFAYAASMHEIAEYTLYDESWLAQLPIAIEFAIRVKSPLSLNWTRLVTSLIPHLLKAVATQYVEYEQMRFFEIAKIWSMSDQGYSEKQVVSGIFFNKKSVDFYDIKNILNNLFDSLHISIDYEKAVTVPAWFDQHKTAALMHKGMLVGYCGMIRHDSMKVIGDGMACAFEIDADVLLGMPDKQILFKPWSKYQAVSYDISMFVPIATPIATIINAIQESNSAICAVSVIDFFEKEDWFDKRAVTLRYTMVDYDKTMTKVDIDAVVASVINALQDHHVQIR